VCHQVIHIDAFLTAADQHLQLRLVEHAHPARSDQLEKPRQECIRSAIHLPVQSEVGQAVDVLDYVVGTHCNVTATGLQIDLASAGWSCCCCCCLLLLLLVWAGVHYCSCERQRQVSKVTCRTGQHSTGQKTVL
jgi:hypothetical protein